MKRITLLLLAVILLSCSARPTSHTPQVLQGKYIFSFRNKQMTLTFNVDSTFLFDQKLVMRGFSVKGNVRYIKKDHFELTVVDTTSWLDKTPFYEYNVKDTVVVLSNKRIKLNGNKFKRVK